MPRDAAREPDALAMWFTRQRKAWWRKWRWVVVATALLLASILLAEITYAVIYVFWNGLLTAAWFPSATSINNWLFTVCPAILFVYIAIAILFGSTESKTAIPSADLAITQPVSQVFDRLIKLTRSRMLYWVVLLYTIPKALYAVVFGLTHETTYMYPAMDAWLACLGDISFTVASSYLLIEFQACVLRCTVLKRSFTFWLLLPLLALPIAWVLAALLVVIPIVIINGGNAK